MKKMITLTLLSLIVFPYTVLAGDTDYWIKIRDKEALMTNNITISEPERPPKGSLEELYQDVFMTMLMPYIDKAVDNYYEKNIGYSPGVAPWQPNILSIERPNGYRTFLFIIKLEVAPYLGAHNSIGVDHITIKVSSGEVAVEKFEHIKDYPIPPWLQHLE